MEINSDLEKSAIHFWSPISCKGSRLGGYIPLLRLPQLPAKALHWVATFRSKTRIALLRRGAGRLGSPTRFHGNKVGTMTFSATGRSDKIPKMRSSVVISAPRRNP